MKSASGLSKKITAVVLSALMLMCFVPFAFAEGSGGYSVDLSRRSRWLAAPAAQADPGIDWEGIYDKMFATLYDETIEPVNDRVSVDLKSYGVPATEENINYIVNMLVTRPELFACRDVRFNYYVSTGLLTRLSFITNPAENRVLFDECADGLEKLLFGIKDNTSLSNAEKLLLLHDRLVAGCSYNNAGLEAGTLGDDDFSPYGVLVKKTAVCTGYSLAYKWLCDIIGIGCEFISSDALNHAFNLVTLGGKKYFVDTSWDDPVWDVPGRIEHRHFLQSFSKFISTHPGADDVAAVATGSEYDNWFTELVKNEIFYIDGSFYYFTAPTAGSNTCSLIKRTGGAETVLFTVSSKQTIDKGTFYVISDYFPRAVNIGRDIIYLSKTAVRAYNVSTGEDRQIFEPRAALLPSAEWLLHGIGQCDGTVSVTSFDSVLFKENTIRDYTDSFTFCPHTHREPETEINGRLVEICSACRMLSHSVTLPCGENLDWTYDADKKELTVTGEGGMYDFNSAADTPWAGFAGEIKRIVVEDGVTSIGGSAFAGCTGAESIELPKTVTAIGENAFADCGVTDVYYAGTQEEFENIEAGGGNTALTGATVHPGEKTPCPHVFKESVLRAPTCTEDGAKANVCIYCGAHSVAETPIPSLGHSFVNYVYNNDATPERDGTETARCVRCTATDTRFKAGTKLRPVIAIAGYRDSRSLDYGMTITFSAQVANAPGGAAVVWYKDGSPAQNGGSFSVRDVTGSFTVQAKLMSGSTVLAETPAERVEVNSGFFARIIAFFRKLFRANTEVVQS